MIGVRDAARRLGVHENTVRNWTKAGVLTPARLPSGTLRFDEEEINRVAFERTFPEANPPDVPAAVVRRAYRRGYQHGRRDLARSIRAALADR